MTDLLSDTITDFLHVALKRNTNVDLITLFDLNLSKTKIRKVRQYNNILNTSLFITNVIINIKNKNITG